MLKLNESIGLVVIQIGDDAASSVYLAEKNPRTHPEKLTLKKYDKKSKKHEEFVEKKLK